MSLRSQAELAELRRRVPAPRSVARLLTPFSDVLRVGLGENDRKQPPPAPVGADGAKRGGRLQTDPKAFDHDRRWRLTASMLPYWTGLQKNSGVPMDAIIRVMAKNDGLWKWEPSGNELADSFARAAMQWGIDHEWDAICAYMEVTRQLVGLGSTRVRNVERGIELPKISNSTEWTDLMSATPDGFTVGVDEVPALLEIKCPASNDLRPAIAINGVERRHFPDIRIEIVGPPVDYDADKYATPVGRWWLLLQVWQQLAVCTQARYCDLVHWKRAYPQTGPHGGDPDGVDYVWISRFYRSDVHFPKIRQALHRAFRAFDHAKNYVNDVDLVERMQRARHYRPRRGEGENDEDSSREYGDHISDVMSDEDRRNLKIALHNWAMDELRWRYNDRQEKYPWLSYAELGERPTDGWCHRFCVQTGEVATHGYEDSTVGYKGSTVLGYRVLSTTNSDDEWAQLKTSDMWHREPIGFAGTNGTAE